jgi:hypothetical protein
MYKRGLQTESIVGKIRKRGNNSGDKLKIAV